MKHLQRRLTLLEGGRQDGATERMAQLDRLTDVELERLEAIIVANDAGEPLELSDDDMAVLERIQPGAA